MKRRVAVARAVLAPGEVLVLDEPFTGLDRDTKAAVLAYLKDHTQGRTLLLVTHDPAERDALAQHTLDMAPGGVDGVNTPCMPRERMQRISHPLYIPRIRPGRTKSTRQGSSRNPAGCFSSGVLCQAGQLIRPGRKSPGGRPPPPGNRCGGRR